MPHGDTSGANFPSDCARALAAEMASSSCHAVRYFMAPGMGDQGLLVELGGDPLTRPALADDHVEPEVPLWTT